MRVDVVAARKRHLRIVEQHLTKGDLAELDAGGLSPREALYEGLYRSIECKAILLDGRPVAIFGLAQGPEDYGDTVGVPWLLSTDAITEIPLTLIREGRKVVRGWKDLRPTLMNTVFQGNPQAKRLIQALGFEFPDVPTYYHPKTGEAFDVFSL